MYTNDTLAVSNSVLRIGVRFGTKASQIGPKLDKFGTFSDEMSVHFGSPGPKYGMHGAK